MYKLICEDEKLSIFGTKLVEKNPIISLDTETTGLYYTDAVVGISISWEIGKAVYISVNHKEGPNCSKEAVKEFLEKIKSLRIVFHNAKFDLIMLYGTFGKMLPMFADTMIYAYALGGNKGLKDLSSEYFNSSQKEFSTLMKEHFGHQWNSKGFNMSDIPSDDPELLEYACEDADYTLQLFYILGPKCESFKNIVKIEENIVPIIVKMNYIGAPVDRQMLIEAIKDYKISIEEAKARIDAVAGRKLEVNSPHDLGQFLFGDLKLPVIKRSGKTGAPSTDKEVLEELSDMHPVVADIDSFRKESRMMKAYLEKIPEGLDEDDRIHTEFDNTGAISGRFTSSSTVDSKGIGRGVNLQNIPRLKKRKIDMRAAFIAPKGFVFIKADYSQIEYRVMASLSQDPFMIKNFKAGVDFHTQTASIIEDVDISKVTSEMRDRGKIYNFGLSYGMTAKGLAMRVGISEEEAANKVETYFKKVPGLVNLINSAKARALKEQATYTFFGRYRPLLLKGLPGNLKERLLRKAFNTMIQGTAADILKIAMLRVKYMVLNTFKSDVQLIMTVHDELCFLGREDKKDLIMSTIKKAMEVPVPDNWVPFLVDVEHGPNWSSETLVKFINEDKAESFTKWGDVLPKDLPCSLNYFKEANQK